MTARRFNCPEGCNIESIGIRELTGHDEVAARRLAQAKGDGREAASTMDELVRLSIVQVNDEPAAQPLRDYDGWNVRTRSFVFRCYLKMNGLTEEEYVPLVEEGTPLITSVSGEESSGARMSG